MIVCMCRGVSERQILEAVQCGARSLDDVANHCEGAGTDCGSCQAFIEHLTCSRADDCAA